MLNCGSVHSSIGLPMPFPAALDFKDSWLLEDSRQYVLGNGRPDTVLREKILGHLLFLAQEGRIGPMQYADEVRAPWVAQWEALFDPTFDQSQVGERWIHMFSQAFVSGFREGTGLFGAKGGNEEVVAEFHRKALAFMEVGRFEFFDVSLVQGQDFCSRTGAKLAFEFEGWVPTLGIQQAPSYDFVPVTPGLLPRTEGLHEMEVDFPSGQLLVADWFRIDAFSEVTDEWEEVEGFVSLNSEAGQLWRTQRLAEQGVVCVGTHRSPAILQEGGVLQAVVLSEEGETLRSPVGSVSTRLWAVSVVDRQTLREILEKRLTPAEATAAIDEMMATEDITQVSVKPGRHHLYFGSTPEHFAGVTNTLEANWEGVEEPVFALSDHPLVPALKPAPKRRLRG